MKEMSLKNLEPNIRELAKQKLELTQKIQELKLEVSKVNQSLLAEGGDGAEEVIASW